MGLATSLIGAYTANKAANTQADATRQASELQASTADKATAEQQRQFDLTRSDLAPYREAGYGALNRLTNASTGNMSDFFTSPDYNFVRSEGQRDIGNSFAARGGAGSGNALRALAQYNANLAAGQYGDWWNRQAGIAGVGQTATSQGAQLGQQTANSITGIQTNAANNIAANTIAGGNARASGILGVNNAFQNDANNTAQYAAYFFGKGGFGKR